MTFKVYPYEKIFFVDAIDKTLPDGSEESHAYFILNDADELLLLRDTINAAIEKFNLTPTAEMKKQDKSQNSKLKTQGQYIPGYCFVFEGYLEGWAPADTPGAGTVLKTSQEIADDLEDMVEISTVDVASIMSQLGFQTHYTLDGPHGWMMRRDPAAVHTIRPADPEEK